MKVDTYKIDGTKASKKAELSDSVFAIEPNETLMYEDVRRHLANKRQGTAKTKDRSEVTGSRKKLYRQKGTGNARRGSAQAGILKGGGTFFGPKPRTYTVKMTKKMRQIARKSALSLKASNRSVMVIEDFTFEQPKTSQITDILKALEINGKKVLLLTAVTDHMVYKSGRNIPKVQIIEANKPTTYDLMYADVLLIQKSAIDVLENSIEPKGEEVAA